MEVLDVALQQWKPASPLEIERTYFGAENLKGQIVVTGGFNLDYKALYSTEIYDVLSDTWTSGPELQYARRNLSTAQLKGRVYAVGGYDSQELLASVEALDPRMRSWTECAPMLSCRSSASCCVADDNTLYVMGGTSGERLNTMEAYDIRMDKWTAFSSDLLHVRSAGAAVKVLGSIYAFGGTDNSHKVHNSLEIFTMELKSWRFGAQMPSARFDHAACSISDSVVTTGGQVSGFLFFLCCIPIHFQDGSTVLPVVDFYRPELDTWQKGPNMVSPRYGHATVLASV
ncbi:MAG: hypothetical protein KVP17_004107 [Porospora cf. gigantea B]|uniref:uncharacterized protein n=1 Tax=Porospora cf. gigantea B TaxID=2853592 RepID=UPI0035719202|nr:MAG: hypothetical protein KVP17_004107 [Porospora cf. gigantea B]